MTLIKQVELHEFKFPVYNLGNLTGANSVGAFGYSKGEVSELKKFAIKIITDDGTVGEYVTHWCSTASTFAQSCMLPLNYLEDMLKKERAFMMILREN